MKDELILMIDKANISEEEKNYLIEYTFKNLEMIEDFKNKISILKNKKEFSNDIISIIENLTKEYKHVKRNS